MRIILIAVFALLAGCSVLPQLAYKAEEDITLRDGTTAAKGAPVYVDATGTATANAFDPVTKAPNKPLMVTDVDKLAKMKDTAEKTAGSLPPPFGWLAGLGVTILGAGGIAGAKAWRRKQLDDAGVPPMTTTS